MTVLQLTGVARHFGRRAVLQDIDLEVSAGEQIALQGANGSGKTTLLRIAAGSLGPTAGTVLHDRIQLAYLPQDAPVYRELSVVDHLRFNAKVRNLSWHDTEAITQLQSAGLDRLADHPAGTLSRGQRQRLGLAVALAAQPELLLLDEPWTALDGAGSKWLQNVLAHTDAAVIAAVHDGAPFQPDRTFLLDGGRMQ